MLMNLTMDLDSIILGMILKKIFFLGFRAKSIVRSFRKAGCAQVATENKKVKTTKVRKKS